jgi:phosphate-selective porin
MFNRTIVAVAIIMTLVTTAANAADTVTSATSSTVIDKHHLQPVHQAWL